MTELDETDREILTLLGEDARRPYSEIGDVVGLSGPAVSDRVKRLQEAGIVTRFTVEVDRSQLRDGVPVLVQLSVPSGSTDAVRDRIAARDAVEHVLVSADGDVWFTARTRAGHVHQWIDHLRDALLESGALADGANPADVEHAVTLLDGIEWTPSLDGVEFALTCAECSNTVDSEGASTRIDGELYHFCCPSCQSRFEERYERFDADA